MMNKSATADDQFTWEISVQFVLVSWQPLQCGSLVVRSSRAS